MVGVWAGLYVLMVGGDQKRLSFLLCLRLWSSPHTAKIADLWMMRGKANGRSLANDFQDSQQALKGV